MRKLFSKVLVGLFCFVAGMGVMLLGQRYLQKPRTTAATDKLAKSDPLGAPLYASQATGNPSPPAANGGQSPAANAAARNPDPFFSDPFGQMRAMEKQMRTMQARMMKQLIGPGFGNGFFGSWKTPGFAQTGEDAGSTSVHERQDKNYVYYDIAIKNLGQSKLNVKVSDGQINVSGQVERKSQSSGNESEYSSSFERSFPVPPDVDGNKVQMSRTKDLVTLKFPKLDASG